MSPDDPRFEEWLRDVLRDPSLPDDGFADRVMAAIPPSRHPLLRSRSALVLAWTVSAAGMAAALCLAGSTDWAAGVLARLDDGAALLAARPWISFAVTVAFVSYLGGLYAARAAIGSLVRSR